jgi:hypothetical protein
MARIKKLKEEAQVLTSSYLRLKSHKRNLKRSRNNPRTKPKREVTNKTRETSPKGIH